MSLVIGSNNILVTDFTSVVETTTFGIDPDEIVKIRKGPGSGYSYIGSHNNGDKWKIAEIYNGWARVPNKDEWTNIDNMTVKTKDEVTPGQIKVLYLNKKDISRSETFSKTLTFSTELEISWETSHFPERPEGYDEYYEWTIKSYILVPNGTKKYSPVTLKTNSSHTNWFFSFGENELEETSGNNTMDIEYFLEFEGRGTYRTVKSEVSLGKATFDITPYDPAEPPECIKIDIQERTDTSVKLVGEYKENFDPIDKYQFRYKKESDSNWYTMSEITTKSVSLSSLTPNTKYLVSSRCHNKMGWGEWIEDVEVITKPIANKPVTSVKTSQSVTEVTCTKNSINYPDINYYGLKYKLSLSSEWIELSGQADNVFLLYNLENNTSYDFMTRTRTSKALDGTTVWSEWSDIITAITPPKLGKTTLSCVGNDTPTKLDFKIDYDVPFEEVKKYNVKINISSPTYEYKSILVNGKEVKNGDTLQLPRGIYPIEFTKARFARKCLGNVTANGVSVTNLTVVDQDIDLAFSLKDYYRWKVNLTISGKSYEDNRFCGTFNTISGDLKHILTPDEIDEGYITGYPEMPNTNSVEFKSDPSGAYCTDLDFKTIEDHSGNRFVYVYLFGHLTGVHTATGKYGVYTDITNFIGTISNRNQSEKLMHEYNSTVYDPPKQLWCEYTVTTNTITDGPEEYQLDDLPVIDIDKKEELIPKFQLRYRSLTDLNWVELPETTDINQTLKDLTPGETYTIQSRALIKGTANQDSDLVDKYGATWKKVFSHNTNGDTVWFNSNEAQHIINNEYKYSILDELNNYKGSDGKLELLLEYPLDHIGQYNRWKQTNSPLDESNSPGKTVVDGYEAIHIDWTDAAWGGLSKSDISTSTLIDGNPDSSITPALWYYAIGATGVGNVSDWDKKLPGIRIPGTFYSHKEVDLYVRVEKPKVVSPTIYSQWSQSITVRNVKYSDFKQIRVNKNDSTDKTIKVHAEYLEGYIDINRVYYAAVPITSTVDPGIIPTMFCSASIAHQELENGNLLQPVTIDQDYLGNPLLPNTEYKVYLYLNQYKSEEDWYVKGLNLYKSMSTNAFTRPTVGTLSDVGCTQNNTFDSLKISATKSGTWTIYEGWQLRYKVFTESDLTYTPWSSINNLDKMIENLDPGENYQVQVRGSTGISANGLKYYSDVYSFKIRVVKKPEVNLTITRLKSNEIGVRAVVIDPGYPYISSIDWEYSSSSFISQSYTPSEWKLSSTTSFNKEVPPTLQNFIYKDLYHYARYNIRAKLVQQESNLDWYTSGIDYEYTYDVNDIELPLYDNRTDRLKGYNKNWKKVSSLKSKDVSGWVDLGTNEEESEINPRSNQIWSRLNYNNSEMETGMWPSQDKSHYDSTKFIQDYSIWVPALEPITFKAYNKEDNGYGGKLFKNYYDINFDTLQTTDTNQTKPYLILSDMFEFVKNKNSLSARLKNNITDNTMRSIFDLRGLDRIINLNTIKNIYLEYSIDVLPVGSDSSYIGSLVCNFWSKDSGGPGLNDPYFFMNSNSTNKSYHKFLIPIPVREALELDSGYVFHRISVFNDPSKVNQRNFWLNTKGSIINISNFKLYYTNLSDPY